MTRPSRLHVGCGQVYKPGYWNIDMYDTSVADEVGDIGKLSCATSSIDEIVSSQVIEHFDLTMSKYVLSEWFRVLKPSGRLVLETPDFEKSASKMTRGNTETQKTIMSWIFGIDSPGLQHKTCYTYKLIKETLEEVGYDQVQRERQGTHLYAPGMRIVCRKPDGTENKLFEAVLRRHLLVRIGTMDSYVLTPLEEHLKQVLAMIEDKGKPSPDDLDHALARAAARHPALALAALDALCYTHRIDTRAGEAWRQLLERLAREDFVSRAFSLWMRSKKGPDTRLDFEAHLRRLENTLLQAIRGQLDLSKDLSYVLGLPPEEIQILDFGLIMMESRRWFNVGLKAFDGMRLEEAREAFRKSALMSPGNPYLYWNLARVEHATRSNLTVILNLYDEALGKLHLKDVRHDIQREKDALIRGMSPPAMPVQVPWD